MDVMLTPFILLPPALQRFRMGLLMPSPALLGTAASHQAPGPAALPLLLLLLLWTRVFTSVLLRKGCNPPGMKALWDAHLAPGLPLEFSPLRGEPRQLCVFLSLEGTWNEIPFCLHMQTSWDSGSSAAKTEDKFPQQIVSHCEEIKVK